METLNKLKPILRYVSFTSEIYGSCRMTDFIIDDFLKILSYEILHETKNGASFTGLRIDKWLKHQGNIEIQYDMFIKNRDHLYHVPSMYECSKSWFIWI